MKKLRVLLMLITVSFLTGAAGATARAQNARVLAQAERVTGDRFTVALRTPRGANIYAVRRPAANVLAAIDKGLTDLFAVARKNRYSLRLNYSDYSVYIARADRTTN